MTNINQNVTTSNGSLTLTANQSNVVSEARYGGGVRRVLAITNTEAAGGSSVYLSVGQEAANGKGILLNPGASFVWSMDGGYIPPQSQVTAFSTGTPAITIYEEIGFSW